MSLCLDQHVSAGHYAALSTYRQTRLACLRFVRSSSFGYCPSDLASASRERRYSLRYLTGLPNSLTLCFFSAVGRRYWFVLGWVGEVKDSKCRWMMTGRRLGLGSLLVRVDTWDDQVLNLRRLHHVSRRSPSGALKHTIL